MVRNDAPVGALRYVKGHTGLGMSGDEYRCKAAEMRAKARQATSLSVKRECECLAERYIRLAEMAEINSHTNVVYEPPPVRLRDANPLRDASPPNRPPDRRLPGA